MISYVTKILSLAAAKLRQVNKNDQDLIAEWRQAQAEVVADTVSADGSALT